MTSTQQRPAVIFPPGIDGGALLLPTRHSAWTLPGPAGAQYRRAITAASPLLFALTYLGADLRNQETGAMSFSPLHLDLCSAARRWVASGPERDVWVAPRMAGKSLWLYVALPLWSLAHGHRRFFAAFSYTGKQALGHLGNVLDILHGRRDGVSELLLHDFPELAPVRGAGGPRVTILTGGPEGRRALAAYGIGESSRGLRVNEMRPDLLVGDDIEPGGNRWSASTREAVLSGLLRDILPMNRHAVVQVTGTVTAIGSVIHDAVRAAKGEDSGAWVADEGFTPRYYPAILDEGQPTERSLWPQQWGIEQLRRDRYTADGKLSRTFATEMMNDPVPDEGGAYWSAPFQYKRPAHVRRWVAFVDPAITTHDRSDHTAIVVAGLLTTQRPAVAIAVAEAGHWSPAETARRLDVLRERFPGLQVHVEVNALGSEETARQQYRLRRGDLAPRAFAPKELRIRAAADVYAEGLVAHTSPLPELEAVLRRYGSGERDDLPDALAAAVGVLLPGRVPA